jgi:hypothetical protein
MVHAEPKVENQKENAYGYFVENYGREQTVSFATTPWGRGAQSMMLMLDHYKI